MKVAGDVNGEEWLKGGAFYDAIYDGDSNTFSQRVLVVKKVLE